MMCDQVWGVSESHDAGRNEGLMMSDQTPRRNQGGRVRRVLWSRRTAKNGRILASALRPLSFCSMASFGSAHLFADFWQDSPLVSDPSATLLSIFPPSPSASRISLLIYASMS